MIVRYVCPLTENQRHTLAEIMKHDARPRARVRAHGILLSSQGMRIKEIAKIYQVDRDTVATWIKKWEQSGIASLYDKPRSGRPPKLTPEEKDLARQYINIGKYLSRICKFDQVIALQERFEAQLQAPRLSITFGMSALGMTRQIRNGHFQRVIEPCDVPGLQGLDNPA